MNKSIVFGVALAVIIGIVLVSISMGMNTTIQDEEVVIEEVVIEEVVIEELESETIEPEGRNFSVEFTETVKLKSP